MKKIRLISLAAIFSLVFSLTSCSGGGILGFLHPYGPYSPGKVDNGYDEIAETCFANIMDALNAKDVNQLKQLFFKDALQNAIDFDSNFNYLTDFLKGNILSTSKDSAVGSLYETNAGLSTVYISCAYKITTNVDTYILSFDDHIFNNKDSDDLGLYFLKIYKESDSDKELYGVGDCAGIYRPPVMTDEDYNIADEQFQKIISALENKDSAQLKNMFSTEALALANDMDNGIDYVMSFYKGKIVSTKVELTGLDLHDETFRKKQLKCCYTVTTDVNIYLVFFEYVVIDTANPENEGLELLQIIKASDAKKEFDWGGENTLSDGIYQPNF